MNQTEQDIGGIVHEEYYFWLGDDGTEEVTEAEFEAKIEAVRKAQDDYLNAR